MTSPIRGNNFGDAYDMQQQEYFDPANPDDVYCETCGQKLPKQGEAAPPDDSYEAPALDPRAPSTLPDMTGAKPLQMPR